MVRVMLGMRCCGCRVQKSPSAVTSSEVVVVVVEREEDRRSLAVAAQERCSCELGDGLIT
jgi:hypothetical protein